MQGGMLQNPPLNQGPPNQPLTQQQQQQQQWYRNQQLLAMQRQQQQQQAAQQQQQPFQQPGAPPSYQQRLPAIRQPHMSYNSYPDQQYPPMQGLKPTPPPVPSPQGVMGPPQGGISVQQQQQLRSPPPIRSPQPSPSSRPSPSPRNQAVASPRGPQPSPHDMAASEMLLGQNHTGSLHPHASPVGGSNQETGEVPALTPQDQLSKFVEQL